MDPARLRHEFPHTADTIYLNHAAIAPLSRSVKAAVEGLLAQRHGTLIENYFDFMPTIDATRAQVGRLLGVPETRVAFVPNTSYGLSVVAQGIDWQPGDRIALPGCEFPANVYPFMNLQHRGVTVDFIPHDQGTFTLDDVASTLTERTRLLTVSWVQFLSGFRADLKALGDLCRERGVLFCVDAIQGAGALQLDVEACGIDVLACGGHKWLMATQGIGVLYVAERVEEQIRPAAGWLHGPIDWENFFDYELAFHPDARRYEMGTMNQFGLGALHASLALREEAGPAWCEERVLANAQYLADGLADLGLPRYGTDDPAHASGIVTVDHPAPEDLYEHLQAQGIVASVRNRLVRFAPTWYNTTDELDATLDAVANLPAMSTRA